MSLSTRSIDVLLRQLNDPSLRSQLQAAVNALRQQTQFGLVFEGHHPEVSRLPDYPVGVGSLVAKRADKGNVLFRVASINGELANCYTATEDEQVEGNLLALPLHELVVCKRFGDAIYPSLAFEDAVQKDETKPWHVLIEADNFHALQLLSYTHREKIDVIYIDPPYNTGARDWKYNNDYVDNNDPWKHSKWLSFMEKRLALAEKLLKPDGVLVVTIDEHEVHHLACLLEQTFRDAYQQMVTIVINPAGVTQGRFSRVEEHALFCFRGNAKAYPGSDDFLTASTASVSPTLGTPQWESLLRRGTGARRSDRKSMFYPVVIDPERGAVVGVGEPLAFDQKPDFDLKIGGFPVAWPIRTDLSEGRWKVGAPTLKNLIDEGFVKVGRFDPDRKTWGITYATRKIRKLLEDGEIVIRGRNARTGALELEYANEQTRPPRTVWNRNLHNAGPHGTDFLRLVFGEGERFPFPKSLYSVRDTLLTLVRDKKDAIVLDFFGGSGTTYNAVALLNSQDGGRRQSITVTNNEVAEAQAKRLLADNTKPGDATWEAHGICRAVTWPRMKYVTQGFRSDGVALPGEYYSGRYEPQSSPPKVTLIAIEGSTLSTQQRRDLVRLIPDLPMNVVKGSQPFTVNHDKPVSILWDINAADQWLDELQECTDLREVIVFTNDSKKFRELSPAIIENVAPVITLNEVRKPLSDGLMENICYLRLGFLDPDEVASGEALSALMPVLWLMAGAQSACPKTNAETPAWIISTENKMAILLKEGSFQEFMSQLNKAAIDHIFLVTDGLDAFKEMSSQIRGHAAIHMLYSSYLRNFRIMAGGGSV